MTHEANPRACDLYCDLCIAFRKIHSRGLGISEEILHPPTITIVEVIYQARWRLLCNKRRWRERTSGACSHGGCTRQAVMLVLVPTTRKTTPSTGRTPKKRAAKTGRWIPTIWVPTKREESRLWYPRVRRMHCAWVCQGRASRLSSTRTSIPITTTSQSQLWLWSTCLPGGRVWRTPRRYALECRSLSIMAMVVSSVRNISKPVLV